MEGSDPLFETPHSPVEPVPQAKLLPSNYGGEKEFNEQDYQSEWSRGEGGGDGGMVHCTV